MIRIETSSNFPSVRIEGTSKQICTELLIVITKLIENDMLSEDDRHVIKLVAGLDKEIAIIAQNMLKDSLNLGEYTDKSGGTSND